MPSHIPWSFRIALPALGLLLLALAGLAALGPLGSDTIHSQQPEPRWVAELTGLEAVPPNDSDATGIFLAYPNGDTIEYTLFVPTIERATAVTLNLATREDLGEPIAFVFRPAEPAVEALSERRRGAPGEYDVVNSLNVNSFITPIDNCGFHCWGQLGGSLRGDLPGFIRELDAGNVYVTVLTKIFRQGELRGRIQLADLDDPRTVALIAEASRPRTSRPSARQAAGDHDDGFPAWGWAIIVAGIAAALVASSTARQ